MRPRRYAIAAGITVYVLLGSIACLYLAGAIYYVANHLVPSNLSWDTWLTHWDQYANVAQQRGKLQFAAGAALFIVFAVPLLIASVLANKARPLHGDARFAHAGEIAAAGLYTEARGILIGRQGGRYLVFGGQQFVLLAAPTRSGKGVGVVIPNLLNYPDSVVVLDIKLENFKITSGFRAAHGQSVFLFNPFAEDGCTHAWNPLDGIRRASHLRVGDILAITQVLYPNEQTRETFWNDQARNLFMGLTLYLLDTPALPCTMGELLRQSSGKGQSLKEYLQGILTKRANGPQALADTCQDALNRFISTSDNTLSGILATFNAPLTIFANPIVDAATRRSDFDPGKVRQQRMSIYLGIPPNRLSDAALLMNLFFSQLINLNTQELPEANSNLKYQCLLLLDEFTAIGKIGILARGVAFMAGYNLRMLPIVQSIAQLQSVYGDRDTRTFVTNHAVQIVFAPREQRDALEYSEMLGYLTETQRSRSITRPRGFNPHAGSMSENESVQRRALLLPQELKELGDTKAIIFAENCKPILCEKNRYYDDAVFKHRLLPAVQIPAIDFSMHEAMTQQRIRELAPDEPIVLEALVKPPTLPALDDPHDPSDAALAAVVDAAFDFYDLPSRQQTQAALIQAALDREHSQATIAESTIENTAGSPVHDLN